jgi:hypothetical protein
VTSGEERAARLQKLFALERRHNFFSYRVDGWSAWRVMRNPVYWRVADLPLSKPARPTYIRVFEALRGTLGLLRLLIDGRQKELLIKTCRSALRARHGDKYEDLHFDSLLRGGYSCIKLEEINTSDFDMQAAAAWRPADLNAVVFTFWGRTLGRLFPADAMPFCRFVAEHLQSELDVTVAPRWLLMRISSVVWQARLYGALLARIKPRAILVSDTGEYGLRVAAYRANIRFIEVQHGVFDATQPDAIPLWVDGSIAELALPDVLATRGSYWMKKLATTRQGEHAVAVGDAMTDSARARRAAGVGDSCVRLVLTSQGLDTEQLVAWIGELARSAPPSLDWHLSIKLHPIYDSSPEKFDALKSHARIRIISGAEQPNVFDLLADSDLHLTIASACHFDAVAIGVRSAIIPLDGHELLTDTVDNRLFYRAISPRHIWDIVTSPSSISPLDSDRFSARGYVDNLAALLPPMALDPLKQELNQAARH